MSISIALFVVSHNLTQILPLFSALSVRESRALPGTSLPPKVEDDSRSQTSWSRSTTPQIEFLREVNSESSRSRSSTPLEAVNPKASKSTKRSSKLGKVTSKALIGSDTDITSESDLDELEVNKSGKVKTKKARGQKTKPVMSEYERKRAENIVQNQALFRGFAEELAEKIDGGGDLQMKTTQTKTMPVQDTDENQEIQLSEADPRQVSVPELLSITYPMKHI